MSFDEVLAQVVELLRRQGRVSYRALKLRFNLDDDYLEGLREELIYARIFEPLGLQTAGLGPQATFGKLDAPVGHRMADDIPTATAAAEPQDADRTLSPPTPPALRCGSTAALRRR